MPLDKKTLLRFTLCMSYFHFHLIGCIIHQMMKLPAILLTILVIFVISFTTWQLYLGNLEAAFSTLPFLLITYFLMKLQKK